MLNSLARANFITDFVEEQLKKKLAQQLLRFFKVPPPPESLQFIHRPRIEKKIVDFVSLPFPTGFMVVVGPRGSGKSTAVQNVLRGNRSKVVYVTLTSDMPRIGDRIKAELPISREVNDLAAYFRPFANTKGAAKPVLVVEVDSQVSGDYVKVQSQELKRLTADLRLVHGILILSDANAALKLNPDPARQTFLWVDEFERNEMDAYFDDARSLQTEECYPLRERIFMEVGARPQDLSAVVLRAREAARMAVQGLPANSNEKATKASQAECEIFEHFIDEAKEDAFTEINNILTSFSPGLSDFRQDFRRLVLALLEQPSGSGIAVVDVNFAVVAASPQFKDEGFRAVTFNRERKVYQFYSKAHKHAARKWFQAAAEAAKVAEEKRARDWFGTIRWYFINEL
jgi:energy-coupling factor transporter ATP-binding protein EcfA2